MTEVNIMGFGGCCECDGTRGLSPIYVCLLIAISSLVLGLVLAPDHSGDNKSDNERRLVGKRSLHIVQRDLWVTDPCSGLHEPQS